MKPFYGVCGFTANTTSYSGTLFRFPLGKPCKQSLFPTTVEDVDHASKLLNDYFPDATQSLLFLTRIKNVSFIKRVDGKESVEWSIKATKDLIGKDGLEKVELLIEKRRPNKIYLKDQVVKVMKDTWYIQQYHTTLNEVPKHLKLKVAEERLQLSAAVAAPFSSESFDRSGFQGRFFMSFPMLGPNYSRLPVHINAVRKNY